MRRNQVGGLKTNQDFETRFHKNLIILCTKKKSFQSLKFVLGVSGGVDSMVLLELMAKCCSSRQLKVAYFDHGLRKSTVRDKQLIQNRCLNLGLKMPVLGKRVGTLTSENAMRVERHRFLESTRKKSKADFIVLAHHANDQCETFLMRLIRGTSVEGLSGMSRKRGKVLRPFLDFTKKEIINYAKTNQISFFEDETNQSLHYFRNRIRNQFIPQAAHIGKDFGDEEDFVKRISQLTNELQVIKRQRKKTALNWLSINIKASPYWWGFPREKWKALSAEKKRIIYREIWKKLSGKSLVKQKLEQLDEIIEERKSATLSGNIQVSSSQGTVFLVGPKHRKAITDSQSDIWKVCCDPADRPGLKRQLKALGAELRFLTPGDRYQNKKMKRVIQQMGLSRIQRSLFPVIAKKGTHELLWFFSSADSLSYPVRAPWEKSILVFASKNR